MQGFSDRFADLWVAWDTRHDEGDNVQPFLAAAKDEELIELLAGESVRNRKYERDVIATEILNRLHRRNTSVPASADAVLRAAEAAELSAEAGQAAIHTCEALLHAAGEHDLGQAVSESAYHSLDAAKLALDAAHRHAVEVQVNLAQSRLGDEAEGASDDRRGLAGRAAARAAQRGNEITADLERHMSTLGAGPAGKAAAAAGEAMSKAADAAVEAEREPPPVEADPATPDARAT